VSTASPTITTGLLSPATSAEATDTLASTAGFGEPITLAEARKAVAFSVRVPSDARLGDPDLVTIERNVAKGMVTLWWKPNDRLPLPASPSNRTWGMSFSVFRGSVEDGPPGDVSLSEPETAGGRVSR
jgi:hypothetical protein